MERLLTQVHVGGDGDDDDNDDKDDDDVLTRK